MNKEVDEQGLVKKSQITALEDFTSEGLDPILQGIKEVVTEHKSDVTTPKGRKAIASLAHSVAKSKVFIDNAGKELVRDLKVKTTAVDTARREVRDFLDNLKEEARKPLTDWELVEEKRIETEKLRLEEEEKAKNLLEDHEEALREDALWGRERALKLKEEEETKRIEEQRLEDERKKAEEARKLEDERLKKKASEEAKRQAEKEAEEKIQAAHEAKEKAERELKEAEEERIRAEEQAKIDKAQAVAEAERKAKEEADHKEWARISAEKKEEETREKLASDKKHREKLDKQIVIAFKDAGIVNGQDIIRAIVQGHIPHIKIEY